MTSIPIAGMPMGPSLYVRIHTPLCRVQILSKFVAGPVLPVVDSDGPYYQADLKDWEISVIKFSMLPRLKWKS